MREDAGPAGGLKVGEANDPAEKEADRMADRVMRQPDSTVPAHRKCEECTDEKRGEREPEFGEQLQAKTNEAPANTGSAAMPATSVAVDALGTGQKLSRSERAFFEPRFGVDLSSVRVHDDAPANRASRLLSARAFALGGDIGFARGERRSDTRKGRWLMAHELAHVVTEGGSFRRRIRRDLAIEPPNPAGQPGELTERRYRLAERFNTRRFEDPFTIAIIRDVIGIKRYPAVADRNFTDALLRWQAMFNIREHGRFGPRTARRVIMVLRAEGNGRFARLVRSDNFVRVHSVRGPAFFGCRGAPGRRSMNFMWLVALRTSLRNGFIVQQVDNEWHEDPPAPPGHRVPTRRYFEAWAVDGRGRVTPVTAGINDMWLRGIRPGSRGRWRMSGRLYTVLHLPATFGVGNVPDAGTLRSTLRRPGASVLGLPEGFSAIDRGDEGRRTIGGRWDCADPVVGNRFHRRE